MERLIDKHLSDWKKAPQRHVLMLRGARQVGKTFAARKLGQSFRHFVEVNFEEEPEISTFFGPSLNPNRICEKLSAFYNTPIIPGQTLLFLDEIQSCIPAIKALRFFYEKIPELHVIAAGSLLEFALTETSSFGVGRIHSLYMYPLTFKEFLLAQKEHGLVQIIEKGSVQNSIDPIFHKRLIDQLRTYMLIGGMPEAVKYYIETQDLQGTQTVIDNLLNTFRDDFAKYKNRSPTLKLREIFESIVKQSGSKFKYSNISENAQSGGYKEALTLLIQAGLAYKVIHTAAQGLPLGAQENPKKFKMILNLDTE